MACTTQRLRQIESLVAGELSAETVTDLLDHVESCPDCSHALDVAAELVAAGAAARAEVTLRAAGPAIAFSLRAPLLALAAGILLAIGVWTLLRPPSRAELVTRLAAIEPLPGTTAALRSGTGDRGAWWRTAMESYERGDLRATAESLAPRAAERPTDALLHLYLGIARLELEESDLAVDALEIAARTGEGMLQEQALWYASHARLAAGDLPAAINTLERLAALAGDYELDAHEKLTQLRALGED